MLPKKNEYVLHTYFPVKVLWLNFIRTLNIYIPYIHSISGQNEILFIHKHILEFLRTFFAIFVILFGPKTVRIKTTLVNN